MKDTIIKGTGNSRYLKSAIPENITHQQLVDLLRNGAFPIDLNGVNMDGIEQLGTPLNTATLLQDETASKVWFDGDSPTDPVVDRALQRIASNLRGAETHVIGKAFDITTSTHPKGKEPVGTLCYGGGKFVTVKSDGTLYYSEDKGITWQTVKLPSGVWKAVAYGGGRFVAISGSFSNNALAQVAAYSEDAIIWTTSTLPRFANWADVVYGDGRFVAIATAGQSTYAAGAYSIDGGETWTESYYSSLINSGRVAYGNGIFVTVPTGSTSNLKMQYSTDGGETWTQVPANRLFTGLAFGNGKFVAVANGYFASSYNGQDWDETAVTGSWQDVVFCENIFVAITNTNIAYTSDGIEVKSANVAFESSFTYPTTAWGSNTLLVIDTHSTSEAQATITITDITQTDVVNKYGFAYEDKVGGEVIVNYANASVGASSVEVELPSGFQDYSHIVFIIGASWNSTSTYNATIRLTNAGGSASFDLGSPKFAASTGLAAVKIEIHRTNDAYVLSFTHAGNPTNAAYGNYASIANYESFDRLVISGSTLSKLYVQAIGYNGI